MLFFNSSLRTRLSTEKAATNLGMNVIIMNMTEGWNLEFEDGAMMNTDNQSLRYTTRLIILHLKHSYGTKLLHFNEK